MKLSEATARLSDAGIENARGEARILFREIGKAKESELYGANPDIESDLLNAAIERRCKREPLQYIIGKCDFYGETYEVTPDCLIPRQDTEILVEYAVKHIPENARFIDLCTGSGCIAISTLMHTSGTRAMAIDLSNGALNVAKRNAERYALCERIDFINADVLKERLCGEVFAVLSNPPYVTESAYRELEPGIYHEPKEAFLGGADGLIFYKRITELYKDAIPNDGFIAFEIGYDQAASLMEIADKNSLVCEIIKDYSGNDRVAILKKS
jgi:release factor glutamine methyltransferase